MKDGKYPDWYIGAIGFLASYNGKFFGGRAGTVRTKINTIRNYYGDDKFMTYTKQKRVHKIRLLSIVVMTVAIACILACCTPMHPVPAFG